MQLSKHFSLEELTASETAARRGIPNEPDAETVENLKALASGLEQVRELLGHPIHINSGYRGPKLNSAIGGSKNSAHIRGYAADFVCPGYGSPREICHAIMSSTIEFDQLLLEFDQWTHISFAPEMRRQTLTIDANGTRNGIG